MCITYFADHALFALSLLNRYEYIYIYLSKHYNIYFHLMRPKKLLEALKRLLKWSKEDLPLDFRLQ